MKAKEFLESKGIDTLTVHGFKTPNINGHQKFYSAFQILEEYAKQAFDLGVVSGSTDMHSASMVDNATKLLIAVKQKDKRGINTCLNGFRILLGKDIC